MRELIERLTKLEAKIISCAWSDRELIREVQHDLPLIIYHIREMQEALEFYGCVDNWETTYYEQEDGVAFYGDIADRIDKEDVEIVESGEFGSAGKRARDVLAKLGLGEE